MQKLDFVLPCRVTGTRLYGKPLQFIDIKNSITILENQIKYLEQTGVLGKVCLAISDEEENYGFIRLAERKGWDYVLGSPLDVLGRVNASIKHIGASNIGFVSTENPFLFIENFVELYEKHIEHNYDYSMYSDLPEGSAITIIKSEALNISHHHGEDKHRSELVTSYIFDNKDKFKINLINPAKEFQRSDVRVTVDYPEDLVFCRKLYANLKGYENIITTRQVIEFWDKNPNLRKDVENIGIDWGHGRLWE